MDIKIKSNQSNDRRDTTPLRLSEEAIKEFQEIYLQEHKVQLSKEEAASRGLNLLRLFSVIYRPIRKDEFKNK